MKNIFLCLLKKIIQKTVFSVILYFIVLDMNAQVADPKVYLSDVKQELEKTWPQNRTVNLVFHGHSVPAGYFLTPHVNTLQ